MSKRAFVDTNVLLYSVDPSEEIKRSIAIPLLDRPNLALSIQVLQEFYVQAIRPGKPWRMSAVDAAALVNSWRRFPVQELTMAIFDGAMEIHQRHRFSYWDSAIIAAARALGCETLYSEDMSHGRSIEGLTIINPFLD